MPDVRMVWSLLHRLHSYVFILSSIQCRSHLTTGFYLLLYFLLYLSRFYRMSFLTYIILFLSCWFLACLFCVAYTSPKKHRNKNSQAALLGNQIAHYKKEYEPDFRVVGRPGKYAAVVRSADPLAFEAVIAI